MVLVEVELLKVQTEGMLQLTYEVIEQMLLHEDEDEVDIDIIDEVMVEMVDLVLSDEIDEILFGDDEIDELEV